MYPQLKSSKAPHKCFMLIGFILVVLTFCVVYDLGNSRKSAYGWIAEMNKPLSFPEMGIKRKQNISCSDNEELIMKVNDSKQCDEYLRKNVSIPMQLAKEHAVDVSEDSSKCSEKKVKLLNRSGPLTGLVSFPGSGNTWTRHLIQQMTGIGTSSVYCDSSLKRRGFPYECEKQRRRTIVVKTHNIKDITLFEKIVLLVRNPYDSLLSFMNWKKAGHTGIPSRKVLIQDSEKSFSYSLRWYVNLTRVTTEKFKGPVYVLQYENLKTDLANELRNLAKFLNVSVSTHDIKCTVKLQEGNFHRRLNETKHIELLRAIYNKEKLMRLREAAWLSEKLLKEVYNIELDLGSPLEEAVLIS